MAKLTVLRKSTRFNSQQPTALNHLVKKAIVSSPLIPLALQYGTDNVIAAILDNCQVGSTRCIRVVPLDTAYRDQIFA